VIGRKNWLFANTPRGAKASAIIYSIIETAKENKLNPFFYLSYLFEKLPNIDTKDPEALDKLLPYIQLEKGLFLCSTTIRAKTLFLTNISAIM
jgi:hypothetical protein